MDTKSQIITIATKLFQQKGYMGVGLSEIIRACNLSKGALYHHFPGGKEELLLACLQSMKETITNDVEKIFQTYPTMNNATTAMIDKLVVDFETEGTITGYTLTSIVSEMGSLNELVRNSCAELYSMLEEIYSNKLIEEGISVERAHSIALMMTASIEGAIMLTLTKQSSDPLKRISSELSNLV